MYATNLAANIPYDWTIKKIVERMHDEDYNVLAFTYQEGYIFDESQARSIDQKPLVVFDFGEDGQYRSWNNTSILGRNYYQTDYQGEYMRLHEWVSRQNIIAYFKLDYSQAIQQSEKELGIDFPIHPIEFLSWQPTDIHPISKDQWMNRLGDVFHLYGNSHEDRKLLHAALQVKHENILNNLTLVEKCKTQGVRFDLLELIPHWVRYPMEQVYKTQQEFIFSVSLSGFAAKCFRDSESCVNAIPVLPDLNLLRAVPFTDENALLLPTKDGRIRIDESIQKIDEALQDQEALYSRAVAANEAARQFQVDYYVNAFINPHIVI